MKKIPLLKITYETVNVSKHDIIQSYLMHNVAAFDFVIINRNVWFSTRNQFFWKKFSNFRIDFHSFYLL